MAQDKVEADKIIKSKASIKNTVINNSIQDSLNKSAKKKAEIQQKAIEKVKIDAQVSILNNFEISAHQKSRSVVENHSKEIRNQHEKLLKVKELERQAKLVEEKHALQNNLEQLDKMQRRYRNIFDVIEQKQSGIQNSYSGLGAGRNNLARSEVDKDMRISTFVDKQIIQHEVKTKNEFE